jgi:hypothetical protein
MKLEHLERAFDHIGARLHIEDADSGTRAAFALNIGSDDEGQYFVLRGAEADLANVQFDILQTQPHDRHLLLLAKQDTEQRKVRKDRFLCGHDEREWFVAAIPGGASTVIQAKEALKPAFVRHMQSRKGLNARQANLRRNAAFRRQGEWFFIPLERPLVLDENLILRREPIARSGGKAHLVEQVYRTGGETVFVCPKFPRGVTEAQHRKILQNNPKAKSWNWLTMRRNPGVFARGAVRHPDHATIVLHDWHQVLMNTESTAPSMAHVAFLD